MTDRIKRIRSLFTSAVVLLCVALLVARSTNAFAYDRSGALTEEARSRLGVVAAVAAGPAPDAKLYVYRIGDPRADLNRALDNMHIPGGNAGAPLLLALLIIFAGSMLVIDSILRYAEEYMPSMPPIQAGLIDSKLRKTLQAGDSQGAIRNELLAAASTAPGELNPIEIAGPGRVGSEPDYSGLKEKGIDTVLETRVLSVGFEGSKPPNAALVMTARVRLVSTADNREHYSGLITYRSPHKPSEYWTDGDGKEMAAELMKAGREITEKAVEEIFLVYKLPLNPA